VARETECEAAGIKSATVQVKGHNAYGWLKTERGASPGANLAVRCQRAPPHSFASVKIYPVVDDRITVDIKEADVRVDTMRAAGRRPARQQDRVAVRLTHIRQHCVFRQNDARSIATARRPGTCCARASTSGVETREEKPRRAGAKTDIGWGHQIRSYVLQPYQMVKDLRTGVQTSNTGAVLDGDLDQFMEARWRKRPSGQHRRRWRTSTN
jgi:peptide chain release factor 2